MAGIYGGITIDVEWWTSESESSPRTRAMTHLQPHHTAYPSLSGSRALMDPGGRDVSANGLLDVDGTLYGVVVPWRKANTSATAFDHNSFTVECVNLTGAPDWILTDAQHRRLGKIAAEIAALNSRIPGADMIVQHKDVPGTYATACAGPSYNGGLVLQYALNQNLSRKGVPPMSTLFNVLDDSKDRDFLLGAAGDITVVPSSEQGAMREWWKGVSGGGPIDVYYGNLLKMSAQLKAANPKSAGGSSVPLTDAQIADIASKIKVPTAAEVAKAVLDGASGRLAA